jgi:hypothetical protein
MRDEKKSLKELYAEVCRLDAEYEKNIDGKSYFYNPYPLYKHHLQNMLIFLGEET